MVDGFKEETSRSRLNGTDAVNISVKKRTGENILQITDRVDEIIQTHIATWPQGTHITKLMDKAKDVRLLVADLENNILTGLILVILVLLFAMGFRNAVLVGLAVPFSMLLSFAVLYALGITLNMVVLFIIETYIHHPFYFQPCFIYLLCFFSTKLWSDGFINLL